MHAKDRKICLAIPCGSTGGISQETSEVVTRSHGSLSDIMVAMKGSSLLTFTFNALYADALNAKTKEGLTHFVMLHNDIGIEFDGVDKLLDIMDAESFDVLSVVSPIKDYFGLTSTAIDTHLWRPRRLTLKEIHGQLPETFDGDKAKEVFGGALLLNTGCMAIAMDRTWNDEVCFTIRDRIIKRADGVYEPQVEPEDWNFSRWCNARGLKIGCTRAVKLQHKGSATYVNCAEAGLWNTDETNFKDGKPYTDGA